MNRLLEERDMKAKRILCWSSVLWLSAGLTHAQDTNDPARFEKLFKQMQEKQEMLERMVREQKQEIESLKRQIETSRTNALPALAPTPPTVEISPTIPAPESSTVEMGKPWNPHITNWFWERAQLSQHLVRCPDGCRHLNSK
jgi:cell division protein FtsN